MLTCNPKLFIFRYTYIFEKNLKINNLVILSNINQFFYLLFSKIMHVNLRIINLGLCLFKNGS
jgi:hypothetical protein